MRDELAKEIDALRSDAGIDLAAVSARLQALARTVLDLPARGAKFSPTQASVATDSTGAALGIDVGVGVGVGVAKVSFVVRVSTRRRYAAAAAGTG